MIVASCPACREQVTVPIDASPSSLVRCPLCNAEFRLGEFLSQLPPPLIVVRDQGAQPAVESNPLDTPRDARRLPPEESRVAETVTPGGTDEPLPSFDFTPGSAPLPQAGRIREPVRRPPRPQKNMAWEIAKIVGGALLAVPAAQVILWWFVPRDWQRDLLGIGPAVSRVVPWVVPGQFHDLPSEVGWEAEGERESESDTPAARRRTGPSTSPEGASRVVVHPEDLSPTQPQPQPQPKSDRRTEEAEAGELQRGEETAAAAKRSPDDMTAPAKVESKSSVPPATRPASDANVSQEIKTQETRYQAGDLQMAFEQALQASVEWDTSPDQSESNREAMTDVFYQSFARLGEVLYSLSRDDRQGDELLNDLHVLLESFSRQPKKLAMIGNRVQAWLAQSTRPNSGVILFGTVRATHPFGDVFATDLELAARQQRAVTVISPGDPLRFYGVGDRVLILGILVPPPADVVAAAPDGETPETFVWGSLPVALGK